ncbi:MAG: hypothetical protein DMF93_07205 [Acidobacteria bacterium]|nr:MAG: hypothetical protein DMF93_07205 [Acidobacteriota bacterium]
MLPGVFMFGLLLIPFGATVLGMKIISGGLARPTHPPDLPDPPGPPGPPDPPGPPGPPGPFIHHSPDVRHGPAQRITVPPAKPRRSVVTRTGRSAATATRAGTGWRQRRSADTSGDSGFGIRDSHATTTFDAEPAESAEESCELSTANGAIANAPGRYESTLAGAPKRSGPISAPRRATSVDSRSGVGTARANSVCCSTRPGVGSITIVTRSMPAPGGCASRSRSASVRSVRTSRIGVGSSSRRAQTSRPPSPDGSRVTSRSSTCSTAAPRSRRSSRVDNGSSSRVSTNDSGSSSSIGHSRSSVASNRSSASVGTSGRTSSPRAIACHASARFPIRAARSAGGSAASSPSVLMPHCLNAATAARADLL